MTLDNALRVARTYDLLIGYHPDYNADTVIIKGKDNVWRNAAVTEKGNRFRDPDEPEIVYKFKQDGNAHKSTVSQQEKFIKNCGVKWHTLRTATGNIELRPQR